MNIAPTIFRRLRLPGLDALPQSRSARLRLARFAFFAAILILAAIAAWQVTSILERQTNGLTRYIRVDAWAIQEMDHELQEFRSHLTRHVAGRDDTKIEIVRRRLASVRSANAIMLHNHQQSPLGSAISIENASDILTGALDRIEPIINSSQDLRGNLEHLERVENILIEPTNALRQLALDIASVRQQLQDGDLRNVRWLIGMNKWMLAGFLVAVAIFIALLTTETINAYRAERNATQTERRTRYLAEHDPLTDLPNRNVFFDRAQQAIDSSNENGEPFAVMLIDLDRFKVINDTLGHAIGDQVLVQVGARFRRHLRDNDTIARLGGDEFGVLLPEATELADVVALAEVILKSLQEQFAIDHLKFEVGASIGIAMFPDHATSKAELVQRADVAMYAAKKSVSGYCVYDADADFYSVRHLTLTGALRGAIENGELEMHYQPKLDLARHRVTGVEALIRWNHPTHGSISPDEFVPFAEQTDLIVPLSDWVLETTISQMAAWRQQGIDLDMSINMSTRTFQDPLFLTSVARTLNRWAVPAKRLVIEITETVLMSDPERAKEVTRQLSEMGLRLSIDDFGTGFSSLAYLKDLQAHELKIDKSFVVDMLDDDRSRKIVASTIGLAHGLELKVVAEGIESPDISVELAEMGCNVGQGYLYSRPLASDDLISWLANSPWNPEICPLAEVAA